MAAKKHGDNSANVPDLTNLVRSVQRLEGNPECFGTAGEDCDRRDCAWREYCLKQTPHGR